MPPESPDPTPRPRIMPSSVFKCGMGWWKIVFLSTKCWFLTRVPGGLSLKPKKLRLSHFKKKAFSFKSRVFLVRDSTTIGYINVVFIFLFLKTTSIWNQSNRWLIKFLGQISNHKSSIYTTWTSINYKTIPQFKVTLCTEAHYSMGLISQFDYVYIFGLWHCQRPHDIFE